MTVATPAAPARPTLRLLPVPRTDPPYDDEVGPSAAQVDGALALSFPPASPLLPLRLVPPAEAVESDADAFSPPPDAQMWSRRLAQAIVEVLAGVRAAAQLSRFASFDVLEQLERWTGRFGGNTGGAPARRPAVVSVRVCEPCALVAEACAVVDTGHRHRAFAIRLEASHGRWRCTELQLG